MEMETITRQRGSAETAAWFRARLDELGIGQSDLARVHLANGDDRPMDTILRNLRRMASGEARVSGEMRAWLTHALWVKAENERRAKDLDQQIELLRSGQMHTSSNRVDTTAESLARVEGWREELRKLPAPFAVP